MNEKEIQAEKESVDVRTRSEAFMLPLHSVSAFAFLLSKKRTILLPYTKRVAGSISCLLNYSVEAVSLCHRLKTCRNYVNS